MNKAFMVSPPMGTTSIAVEPLSFSKNFLLVLVERLPQRFPEILAKEEESNSDWAFGLLFGIKVKS